MSACLQALAALKALRLDAGCACKHSVSARKSVLNAACMLQLASALQQDSWWHDLLEVLRQVDDVASRQVPEAGDCSVQEVHHSTLLLHHVGLQHTQEVMPAGTLTKSCLQAAHKVTFAGHSQSHACRTLAISCLQHTHTAMSTGRSSPRWYCPRQGFGPFGKSCACSTPRTLQIARS